MMEESYGLRLSAGSIFMILTVAHSPIIELNDHLLKQVDSFGRLKVECGTKVR